MNEPTGNHIFSGTELQNASQPVRSLVVHEKSQAGMKTGNTITVPIDMVDQCVLGEDGWVRPNGGGEAFHGNVHVRVDPATFDTAAEVVLGAKRRMINLPVLEQGEALKVGGKFEGVHIQEEATKMSASDWKTLEEYLAEELTKGTIEHLLRTHRGPNGEITFYIHPNGRDGDTQDYLVSGNTLAHNPAISKPVPAPGAKPDTLLERIREAHRLDPEEVESPAEAYVDTAAADEFFGPGRQEHSVPKGFAAMVTELVRNRGGDYGTPAENHQLTAAIWGAWLSRKNRLPITITAEDVCMLNVLQKASRLACGTKDDSWLDIAGYVENVAMIREDQRNRPEGKNTSRKGR